MVVSPKAVYSPMNSASCAICSGVISPGGRLEGITGAVRSAGVSVDNMVGVLGTSWVVSVGLSDNIFKLLALRVWKSWSGEDC